MVTSRSQSAAKLVKDFMEKENPKTPRQLILDEAFELTHGSRNTQYGNPEDNFNNIARFWNSHLVARFGAEFNCLAASDVAVMMIGMKLARLSTNASHHDSAVDVAGYAACLGDIQESMSSVSIDIEYVRNEKESRNIK